MFMVNSKSPDVRRNLVCSFCDGGPAARLRSGQGWPNVRSGYRRIARLARFGRDADGLRDPKTGWRHPVFSSATLHAIEQCHRDRVPLPRVKLRRVTGCFPQIDGRANRSQCRSGVRVRHLLTHATYRCGRHISFAALRRTFRSNPVPQSLHCSNCSAHCQRLSHLFQYTQHHQFRVHHVKGLSASHQNAAADCPQR